MHDALQRDFDALHQGVALEAVPFERIELIGAALRLHRAIAQGETAALVTLGRLHCTTTSGALGCHAVPCLRSATRCFILAIAAGDLHADLCWRRLYCTLTGGDLVTSAELAHAAQQRMARYYAHGAAPSAHLCLSMWGHDRVDDHGRR